MTKTQVRALLEENRNERGIAHWNKRSWKLKSFGIGLTQLRKLAKKNPKGMDDEYLLERIDHIENTIHDEEMWVRECMAGALMGIGKRNKELNTAAIRAAKAIGPIDVDYGDDNACEPLNVLKHLTSDSLKKKLGA